MTRILLVEDEQDNQVILSRRLEKRGYEVLVAGDGVEACALARAQKPDLVLMDVRMPRMDGWEATRQLKGDPATCAIPVIVLTGDVMPGERERALQVGCDDFHGKPVNFVQLLGQIQVLLAREASA
jgi:CheY-like chemotaxis protein